MRLFIAVLVVGALTRTSSPQSVADAIANPVGRLALAGMFESAAIEPPRDTTSRYHSMLDEYWIVLRSTGLPALGALAVAEQSPFLLQSSSVHAQARSRVNIAERALASIEEALVRDLCANHAASAGLPEHIIQRLSCCRIRGHLRSRVAALNPAIMWDIEDAVDALNVDSDCRLILAPELSAYRARLLVALSEVDRKAAAMHEDAARALESQGFIVSDIGVLGDPAHDVMNFRRAAVAAWDDVVLGVLSSARIAEQIQWEFATRVELRLPLQAQLRFRGATLQALLNPLDDGALERRLAKTMSAFADGTAEREALDRVAMDLLRRKSDVLTQAARELASARMKRSYFADQTSMASDEAGMLADRFRSLSDEATARLQALDLPSSAAEPAREQRIDRYATEVRAESQFAMERRWRAPALDLTNWLDVQLGKTGVGAGWCAPECQLEWNRFTDKWRANWERIREVMQSDSDCVDHERVLQLVNQYCSAEAAAVNWMLERIRFTPPLGVSAEDIGAACLGFCTIGSGASAMNPFLDTGGEWLVCVAMLVEDVSDPKSDAEAWDEMYFDAMLPLHVNRTAAWLHWRRTAIEGAMLGVMAPRTASDMEGEQRRAMYDALRSAVSENAESLHVLRTAHALLVAENRRWLEALVSRLPERADEIRRAYVHAAGIGSATEDTADRVGRTIDQINWVELDACRQILETPSYDEARAASLVEMDRCAEATARFVRTKSWVDFVRSQSPQPPE